MGYGSFRVAAAAIHRSCCWCRTVHEASECLRPRLCLPPLPVVRALCTQGQCHPAYALLVGSRTHTHRWQARGAGRCTRCCWWARRCAWPSWGCCCCCCCWCWRLGWWCWPTHAQAATHSLLGLCGQACGTPAQHVRGVALGICTLALAECIGVGIPGLLLVCTQGGGGGSSHARTHARTHTRTHARTHARTHQVGGASHEATQQHAPRARTRTAGWVVGLLVLSGGSTKTRARPHHSLRSNSPLRGR